jgi:hypothetical protein
MFNKVLQSTHDLVHKIKKKTYGLISEHTREVIRLSTMQITY